MESIHGSCPPSFITTWTIHRAHASVTYITDDSGAHWTKRGIVWAAERAQREDAALEMARIQREEK
jgi:hypothetical protein